MFIVIKMEKLVENLKRRLMERINFREDKYLYSVIKCY